MLDDDPQDAKKCFPPEEMVTASELREFLFCERAWFLNRQGYRRISGGGITPRRRNRVSSGGRRCGPGGRQPLATPLGNHSRRRPYRRPVISILEWRQVMLMPIIIAAALVLAAVFLLVRARDQRRIGGLPDGELVYNDNMGGDSPVLVSHRYGLKGEPDALVRIESGHLIPGERQKTLAPRRGPYDSETKDAVSLGKRIKEFLGKTAAGAPQ